LLLSLKQCSVELYWDLVTIGYEMF